MRNRSFSCGMGHVLAHHVVDDQGAPVDDGILDCGVTQVDEGEVPGTPVAHCAPGAHLHSCHGLVSLYSISQQVVMQLSGGLVSLCRNCQQVVMQWSCQPVQHQGGHAVVFFACAGTVNW